MKLELGSFHVKGVEFGQKTGLHNGLLSISKQELRELILSNSSFQDVEIELARPGESTRIAGVLDVVEPRWKVEGQGNVFPGFVGPMTTVGSGRTHRLAGVTVVATGAPIPGERNWGREALIDMTGIGSEYGPFGKTFNLVLNFKADPSLFPQPEDQTSAESGLQSTPVVDAYNHSVHAAYCQVAAHLAKVTQGLMPDQAETFELGPCDESLLRVALMNQARRPYYYGMHPDFRVATLVHPNESFDCALIVGNFGGSIRDLTYMEQNNQILMDLCRRHGKEINFLGHILYGGSTPTMVEKERVSTVASKFAKLLGVQAVVSIGFPASNAAIDWMWTVQKCEQYGIRTSLVYVEVGTGEDDPGFVFYVPEADAIASAGSRQAPVSLPAVKKVVGCTTLLHGGSDPLGSLEVPMRDLIGAVNLHGMTRLKTSLH